MNIISHYFTGLSETQQKQFAELAELYEFWNSRINVISRKDINQLYERHVLHSLGIAKVIQFKDDTRILDVGTGGGFPGIPLAILFPKCEFLLVDSIGKKVNVVNEIASAIGLKNLSAQHNRAEKINEKFDFVVSRAVTRLKEFYPWVRGKFNSISANDLPNGVLYLKGGDIQDEINELKKNVKVFPLSGYFTEDFFTGKYVVYFKG